MSGKRKHNQVINDNNISIKLALLQQANEYAEKQLAEANKRIVEIQAAADKRVVEIQAEADKRVTEADKRVAEIMAYVDKLANKRVEEIREISNKQVEAANARADKAHDRLIDLSKFALNLASKTVNESTPKLESTTSILSKHHRSSITYGCAGQVIQEQSKATFSFIEGTKHGVDEEMKHSIHKYIKRGANVEKITEFKAVVDAKQISRKCIESCCTIWNNEKKNYDKVSASPAKRRRYCK